MGNHIIGAKPCVLVYFFGPVVVKNESKTPDVGKDIRKTVVLKYTEIHHYSEYLGGPLITLTVLVLVSKDRVNSLLKLTFCWRLVCLPSHTNRIR